MSNTKPQEQPRLSGTGKTDLRLQEIVKLLARQAAREFAAETTAAVSIQYSVQNQNSISNGGGILLPGDK